MQPSDDQCLRERHFVDSIVNLNYYDVRDLILDGKIDVNGVYNAASSYHVVVGNPLAILFILVEDLGSVWFCPILELLVAAGANMNSTDYRATCGPERNDFNTYWMFIIKVMMELMYSQERGTLDRSLAKVGRTCDAFISIVAASPPEFIARSCHGYVSYNYTYNLICSIARLWFCPKDVAVKCIKTSELILTMVDQCKIPVQGNESPLFIWDDCVEQGEVQLQMELLLEWERGELML